MILPGMGVKSSSKTFSLNRCSLISISILSHLTRRYASLTCLKYQSQIICGAKSLINTQVATTSTDGKSRRFDTSLLLLRWRLRSITSNCLSNKYRSSFIYSVLLGHIHRSHHAPIHSHLDSIKSKSAAIRTIYMNEPSPNGMSGILSSYIISYLITTFHRACKLQHTYIFKLAKYIGFVYLPRLPTATSNLVSLISSGAHLSCKKKKLSSFRIEKCCFEIRSIFFPPCFCPDLCVRLQFYIFFVIFSC